jgi:hypothetical protein
MARTTAAAVKELLDRNYDTRNVPSLEGFIATANLIVTKVAECAARRSVTLADDHLELMERWLAAHYYTKANPVYQSKTTDGRSASFVRNRESPEPYLNGAMDLDTTGCLGALLSARKRAGFSWLGKRPSQQRGLWERS